jgi:hypothetical protein
MNKLIIKNGAIITDTQGIMINSTLNIASGLDSTANGNNTQATGDYSSTNGQATIASGMFSVAEGQTTTSSGELSHSGGLGSVTPNINEWGRAYDYGGTYGLAQYGFANWVGQSTTNLLNQELFLDGGAGRFAIPANSVFAFEVTMVAIILAGPGPTGQVKMVTGTGLVKNIGGTTSIVGTPTYTTVAQDASMSGVLFQMLANNTNDTIYAAVSGIALTTINYNVTMKYTALK